MNFIDLIDNEVRLFCLQKIATAASTAPSPTVMQSVQSGAAKSHVNWDTSGMGGWQNSYTAPPPAAPTPPAPQAPAPPATASTVPVAQGTSTGNTTTPAAPASSSANPTDYDWSKVDTSNMGLSFKIPMMTSDPYKTLWWSSPENVRKSSYIPLQNKVRSQAMSEYGPDQLSQWGLRRMDGQPIGGSSAPAATTTLNSGINSRGAGMGRPQQTRSAPFMPHSAYQHAITKQSNAAPPTASASAAPVSSPTPAPSSAGAAAPVVSKPLPAVYHHNARPSPSAIETSGGDATPFMETMHNTYNQLTRDMPDNLRDNYINGNMGRMNPEPFSWGIGHPNASMGGQGMGAAGSPSMLQQGGYAQAAPMIPTEGPKRSWQVPYSAYNRGGLGGSLFDAAMQLSGVTSPSKPPWMQGNNPFSGNQYLSEINPFFQQGSRLSNLALATYQPNQNQELGALMGSLGAGQFANLQ